MSEIPPGGPGYELLPRKSQREKIREEIEANRRGEYVVPTWVLAVALVVMLAGLAVLIIYPK
ncbi:MAG TPA: hypothetical protein VHJ83_01235 [Micromonosporaceae bacterium]|nr:hypothetical protein [Micromonosporaceae bacterium]